METFYEKLNHIIDGYQSEMIEDLKRFIEIPSITSHRSEVGKALDYILERGQKAGFHTASLLNGEVGLIEMGRGEETLGILAHVDVVNEGDPEKWRTPPFRPVLQDDALYGRGAIDDKGPVIASLYAMKAVRALGAELGKPLLKKVQLILGTREEEKWTDMEAYVNTFPLPDYGFTPDGEFPVCTIEKGAAALTMVLPFGLDSVITQLEGGTSPNVVPGKCQLTVHGQEKVYTGKSVHGCQPEKGENAILKMAADLVGMGLSASPLSKVAEMLLRYFGDREGAALGLRSESEYYNGEFVHRNIFTPTMIQAREDGTKIVFDIRYAYGTDSRMILAAFQQLASDLGGSVESFEDLPPVYVSRDKPFIRAFAQAYEKMSGLKNEYVLAYGGSYAKAMPNIVSWGPLFPGDTDTCHEENEFITIDALMKNTRIFAAAIWSIAMSAESFK